MVAEGPDEDAAGVVAAGLGPLPQQRREVPGVASDQDAGLLGGQLEHGGVIERAERRISREAEHIVAPVGEGTTDTLGREVGVEKETQQSGFRDLDEWE